MKLATNSVDHNQWLVWKVANDMNLNEELTLASIETAWTESGFHNWANRNVPSSIAISNDGIRVDHNSVGIMQQQVNANGSSRGWGNVNQIMSVEYAIRTFNQRAIESTKHGKGANVIAQQVQKSAYTGKPNKYNNHSSVYGGNYLAHEADAKAFIKRASTNCELS